MVKGFHLQLFQDEIRNFTRTRCLVAFSSSSEFFEFSRGDFIKVIRTRFVQIVVNEFIGLIYPMDSLSDGFSCGLKVLAKFSASLLALSEGEKNFNSLFSSLSGGI